MKLKWFTAGALFAVLTFSAVLLASVNEVRKDMYPHWSGFFSSIPEEQRAAQQFIAMNDIAILEGCLNSNYASVRIRAAEAVAYYRLDRCDLLLRATTDEHPDVRLFGLFGLSRSDCPERNDVSRRFIHSDMQSIMDMSDQTLNEAGDSLPEDGER